MVRKLAQGDVIYVIMPPNNALLNYRSVKCNVKSIYYRGSSQRDSVEYDDNNIPLEFRLTLTRFDNKGVHYTKKYLDKIYFEDELDKMQEDIDNLNKILDFKIKQKQELKEYIQKEFPNWNYKSKVSI